MSLKLHDTLSRELRPLVPSDGRTFRFYCCGPTVYGPAHIGNFRTYVLHDVLRRALEIDAARSGHAVLHVLNITDVDDKTIAGAAEAGVSLADFTQGWIDRFHDDCTRLGLLRPHHEPRATAHIDEQIRLVQTLLDRGHAYAASDGSVYFRIASFADYGKLTRLPERELRAGAAAAAGEAHLSDEYERDQIADFVLWKARKPGDGEVFWPSPWGEGRPGWHLECSAMSMAYLGETFDLHGGGVDLCFPHHENEIAQSEAATGKPFARHWFHCAHLMVEGRKMSKSLGNLHTLDELQAEGHAPETLRYLLLSGHYRQQLNFTRHGLGAAASALDKLRSGARTLRQASGLEAAGSAPSPEGLPPDFGPFEPAWQALGEDLDVPRCLGLTFETLASLRKSPPAGDDARAAAAGLAGIGFALGLDLFAESEAAPIPAEAARLAEERWQAKSRKDFATADRLRGELLQLGFKVLDRKDGYDLEPA
ncbi:MAG: cysteine--tRNA ligase [Puniceicoccaceae bacterium]|nr:MAG: cysteine--tRNA ligase [Puniceicoccaceae bacterium]